MQVGHLNHAIKINLSFFIYPDLEREGFGEVIHLKIKRLSKISSFAGCCDEYLQSQLSGGRGRWITMNLRV